jgi:chemotaxis protein CheD
MMSVRMGEIAVTADPEQELVARGLGSCVGVVMLDPEAGVAGLAHVVLPEGAHDPSEDAPAKYADRAVPEMVQRMRAAGASPHRLRVALVGGASMFPAGRPLDIGPRNQNAVREALAQAKLHCEAAALGGDRGRTLRVRLDDAGVTSTSAGETPTQLLPGGRAGRGPCRTSERSPA